MLRELLTPAAEPEPAEPPAVRRRRRVAVAVTLVAGTAALAATLAAPEGSTAFTVLGFLVAAVWLAGSAAAGPLHLGRRGGRVDGGRTVAGPVALGVLAYVAFLLAALVVRRIPPLDDALDSVLDTAEAGPTLLVLAIALVNAVAEEVFFRGALPAALGPGTARRAVLATLVYVLVTVATLNVALVVAGAVMGTLFTLERLATRGVLAPTLTHLTWSALMLLAFPR